jgi:hypothetical protein
MKRQVLKGQNPARPNKPETTSILTEKGGIQETKVRLFCLLYKVFGGTGEVLLDI